MTRPLARLASAALLALTLALLLALAGYTCAKLYKMAAIRGWLPGAVHKEHVVTAKRVLDCEFGPCYWIAGNGADISQRSTYRENLDEAQWQGVRVGDRVVMAYYGDDPHPYQPDGIYTSAGNFGFDLIVLGVELALAMMVAKALVLRRHAARPGA